MKQISTHPVLRLLRKCILLVILSSACISLYSFTIKKLGDDFLKQLGITKAVADEKITYGLLGGSIDTYGVKNIKNIVLGSRSAITKDLLAYTKKYAQSADFKKQYATIREEAKPKFETPKTPDQLRSESIAAIKKSIAETEANMKKADETMKPIFEKVLAEGKKQLAAAENPANKQFSSYEKAYPQMLKNIEANNNRIIKEWERKYPVDALQYIKPRLSEFLAATEDFDFDAELVTKNGKKIFVNPQYERKSDRWKMAFRAGKEVVQPAREFVQQWLKELP